MHFSSALAAGLLAARASAFLIPPHISEAAIEAKGELVSILAGIPRSIEVDCPGCPFAGIETAEWQTDVENKIHLEFDASLSSGLSINHQSVLSSAFAPPTPALITAVQIRTSDGSATQPLPLDFALERLEPLTDIHNPDNMIIPVRFTIFAIGGQPVKVDTIAIDMIRTQESFTIGRISNVPFEDTPGAGTCDGASLWSLCRLKAFVSFRLHQMLNAARQHANKLTKPKGCHGRKHGHSGPGKMGVWHQGGGKPHHKHHGEHKHHHDHHHLHSRLHRLGKMIHQALRFFLIPAMLGVIGGLMASAVGMFVGQCIVYLWQSLYRRSTGTHEPSLVQVMLVEDKKAPLIEEDELPQYHDIPPEYKDDVESQTVEKN